MGEHCRIRVQKKLKVRLNVTVILYVYLCYEGGGAGARGVWGVSEDQASDFYARFGGRRAIRRGGGGHRQLTPSPQAAITIEHPSRALLSHTMRIP